MAPNPQAPTVRFPSAGWYPPTHQALRTWLHNLSRGPHTAVFDWDNTCLFNDIGDAALRYQLDHLCFWHDPQAFDAVCRKRLGDAGARAEPAKSLLADVNAAYGALWPSIARAQGPSRRGTPAHRDLSAKLAALYAHMAHHPAAAPEQTAQAYALLADFWAPASAATVRACMAHIIARGVAEPLGQGAWRSATAGAAGPRISAFATGLRPHPQMAQLMARLQAQNVTPWVVSASDQRLVRAAAAIWRYPVSPAHIIGIRPQHPGPITYRAGKVMAIRAHLPHPPRLVAGDAVTDLEMLTAFEATQMRLLIHRPSQAAPMARLYAMADAPHRPGEPRTLLQGRSEKRGLFIASARSSDDETD